MYSHLITIAQNILRESINDSERIPIQGTDPDDLDFKNDYYRWPDATSAFSFIGSGEGVMVYIKNSQEGRNATHTIIFSNLKSYFLYYNKSSIDKLLKYFRLHIPKDDKLTEKDLEYAINYQHLKLADHFTRIKTRSGRLWKNRGTKKDSIVVFWCKENDIKPSDLETIKNEFKLKSFYWCALDSKFFNVYGNKVKELGGKNTVEKAYKDFTHEDIVSILARAHFEPNAKFTEEEKEVLKKFSPGKLAGTMDQDLTNLIAKKTHGGFKTPVEKKAKTQTSESVEDGI